MSTGDLSSGSPEARSEAREEAGSLLLCPAPLPCCSALVPTALDLRSLGPGLPGLTSLPLAPLPRGNIGQANRCFHGCPGGRDTADAGGPASPGDGAQEGSLQKQLHLSTVASLDRNKWLHLRGNFKKKNIFKGNLAGLPLGAGSRGPLQK